VTGERACLKKLEGGCQVPIAAHAELDGDRIRIRGLVGSVDGSTIIRSEVEGKAAEAEALGDRLADQLLEMGARPILEEVYGQQ
jgi:hydroxymethylbilane synthase